MSIFRIRLSKFIFCVCILINNNLLSSTTHAHHEAVENSEFSEVDDYSNRNLSLFLNTELKYFFQNHLSVIPLGHGLPSDQNPHNVDQISNRTSAVNFLHYIYYNHEKANEFTDYSLTDHDKKLYNQSDVIISVAGRKIVSNTAILDDLSLISANNDDMYFNVSKVQKNRLLQSGSLRLYKFATSNDLLKNVTSIWIEIYEIKKFHLQTNLNFISKKKVLINDHGWIVLEMTELFRKWTRHPKKNHGVHLKVYLEYGLDSRKLCKLSEIGIVNFENSSEMERHPFAIGFFKKVISVGHDNKPRPRRDLKDMIFEHSYHPPKVRKSLGKNNECNVRKFSFSFEDFGWDSFMIAPAEFNLNYCAGDCPVSGIYSGDLGIHSYLQLIANDLYPDQIPKPCCAASELGYINILYFGHHNNILFEKLDKIHVTKCTCL